MAGDGYNYNRVVNATYDLSNTLLWPRLYMQGDYDRATILLSPCHAPGSADPPQAITLSVTMRRADLFSLIHQGSVILERTLGLSCREYGEGLEEQQNQRRLEAAEQFPARPRGAPEKRKKRHSRPRHELSEERGLHSRAMLRRVMGKDDAGNTSTDAATD